MLWVDTNEGDRTCFEVVESRFSDLFDVNDIAFLNCGQVRIKSDLALSILKIHDCDLIFFTLDHFGAQITTLTFFK